MGLVINSSCVPCPRALCPFVRGLLFGCVWAFGHYAFLFRLDVPDSFTPSVNAFCCVARKVRFSLRAITVVWIFSRTSVFSMPMSSFVHGRNFVVFFAIALYLSHVPRVFSSCRSS